MGHSKTLVRFLAALRVCGPLAPNRSDAQKHGQSQLPLDGMAQAICVSSGMPGKVAPANVDLSGARITIAIQRLIDNIGGRMNPAPIRSELTGEGNYMRAPVRPADVVDFFAHSIRVVTLGNKGICHVACE